MKKELLLLLFGVGIMTSCNESKTTDETISTDTIQVAIPIMESDTLPTDTIL